MMTVSDTTRNDMTCRAFAQKPASSHIERRRRSTKNRTHHPSQIVKATERVGNFKGINVRDDGVGRSSSDENAKKHPKQK